MFRYTSYFTVIKIRFQYRKTLSKKNSKGVIAGVITIEGQGASGPISTGIRCTRQEWDTKGGPRPTVETQSLVRSMVLWEESIYKAAKNLYDLGEPITAQNLIDEKNTKAANLITLDEAYKAYVAYKKSCIGSKNHVLRQEDQISNSTFQTYHKRWVQLQRYLMETNQPKMYAYKADAVFLQSYYKWLKDRDLAAPTVTKYAKLLSEILNWGVTNGLIKNFNVPTFRGTSAPVAPPYNVTEDEVMRIESLILNDSRMERVRDGWLLARELCLHFADYTDLKPEHFTLNKDNRVVFEKARQKQQSGRNIRQISFVSERALAIWKRYDYDIPLKIANQKFNDYLKEIGFLAELNQPLMFSHARDSGIFRWVASGVSDAQTRLAAGWRSTRQMIRYVNLDRRLLDELSASQVQPHIFQRNSFSHIYKAS